MSKTFTLHEAQTLLPVLEALLSKARAAALRGAELELAMRELTQRIFLAGGTRVDVTAAAHRRAEREKLAQEAKDTLAEIESIGVMVQDLQAGHLEFPSLLEGRTILLCWTIGQPAIEHWREADDAVGERRPLDGRFHRGERERLN
ncbi:MAG: DUF2203 domain-containing protein [Acidobacteriota bacterium]|nr:DUF2203 domain-containing protein [Acidobacteriota bacterium]